MNFLKQRRVRREDDLDGRALVANATVADIFCIGSAAPPAFHSVDASTADTTHRSQLQFQSYTIVGSINTPL